MKSRIFGMIALLVITAFLIGCGMDATEPNIHTFKANNRTSDLTIAEGESVTLTVSGMNEEGMASTSDYRVKIEILVDGDSVASVTTEERQVKSFGEDIAVSFDDAGTYEVTAKVTAETGGNSVTSDPITITVEGAPEATGISISDETIGLDMSTRLTVTKTPSNAATPNYTWTSSNENVATVSSTGTVTGVSEGTAEITVETDSGLTDTATVTVSKDASPGASMETAEKIEVEQYVQEADLPAGETKYFTFDYEVGTLFGYSTVLAWGKGSENGYAQGDVRYALLDADGRTLTSGSMRNYADEPHTRDVESGTYYLSLENTGSSDLDEFEFTVYFKADN